MVITNIALDHVDYLGSTIEAIAGEKAGIIKPGNVVITGADGVALEVIRAKAHSERAHLVVVGSDIEWTGRSAGLAGVVVDIQDPRLSVHSPLVGHFQCSNLAVAVSAARSLGLDERAIVEGARETSWPGRMQWIDGSPSYLIDGAHNPAGVEAVVDSTMELCPGRRPVIVFGAMQDKLLQPMVRSLQRLSGQIVFTAVDSPRASGADQLTDLSPESPFVASIGEAIGRAAELAGPNGLVVVTGSLALAGEALQHLGRLPATE